MQPFQIAAPIVLMLATVFPCAAQTRTVTVADGRLSFTAPAEWKVEPGGRYDFQIEFEADAEIRGGCGIDWEPIPGPKDQSQELLNRVAGMRDNAYLLPKDTPPLYYSDSGFVGSVRIQAYGYMLPGAGPKAREDVRQFAIAEPTGAIAFIIDCTVVGIEDAVIQKKMDDFLASMRIKPR